jgi:hypothetical protein
MHKNDDFDFFFKEILKRKIISAKMENLAAKAPVAIFTHNSCLLSYFSKVKFYLLGYLMF